MSEQRPANGTGTNVIFEWKRPEETTAQFEERYAAFQAQQKQTEAKKLALLKKWGMA